MCVRVCIPFIFYFNRHNLHDYRDIIDIDVSLNIEIITEIVSSINLPNEYKTKI